MSAEMTATPFDDPHWPRASAWLAGSHFENARVKLAVIGAPLNRSITPGHCHEAPAAIRKVLERFSLMELDRHVDLRAVAVSDLGDLDLSLSSPEDALEPIANLIRGALGGNDAVIVLGGDNGITRPGVHGMGVDLARCGLLTLDAHFDLRDTKAGLHNGNPVRALLKDGLPGPNISQIGLQSFANSPDYAEIAVKANIAYHTVDQVREIGLTKIVEQELVRLGHLADVIYVDLDVDVLDRVFTPGTPGARPGGLMPSEVRRAAYLLGANNRVRVMDIVEVDPQRDVNDVSIMAAASFLLGFAAGMVSRHSHGSR